VNLQKHYQKHSTEHSTSPNQIQMNKGQNTPIIRIENPPSPITKKTAQNKLLATKVNSTHSTEKARVKHHSIKDASAVIINTKPVHKKESFGSTL
jgi:hypothetical protein